MEERLREAKTRMLKGELSDLTFTNEMKENVLNTTQGKRRKFSFGKKTMPSLISAALVMLFFAGIYEFVLVPNLGENQHGPGANSGNQEGVPVGQDQTDEEPDGQNSSDEQPDGEAILPWETEHEAKQPNSTIEQPVNDDAGGDKTDGIDTVIEEPVADVVHSTPEAPDVMGLIVTFRNEISALFQLENFTPHPEYKAKNASTKKEFFRPLEKMADPGFFYYLLYRFLEETDDGVYFLAQDGPFHFETDKPYETKKLADTKYQLVQKLYTDMYGPNYTLTVTVEYIDGKWIIKDIKKDY
ncbi:hypothetical protein D1B31_13840 [Neobacillus notoginsengisoli]|uniref:Uncharacterized protein n=1 Tax=Neobacillus notoginsengisoli TaxID=1578198 RepID=A0A417YSV4_9BACI|nr:hypothetical protein [Neobacillus notoginsengisoli]RHW39040.1 hypothetical protein D1B31_13840 [Neobacillus notoginsengisoli]